MSHHDRIIDQVAVFAVAGAFLIETGTNMVFGYRIAGAPLAIVAVAIAIFGAWTGIRFRDIRGQDPIAWTYRVALALPFLLCLAFSQWSGWSVYSQMLADGAVHNTVKAKEGSVARDELGRLEALQKKVGVTRPASVIQGEIDAALSVALKSQQGRSIRDVTGDCATPAFAPTTCRRVGELKTELKLAEEAERMPGRVAGALKAVQEAPKVGAADAYLAGAQRVFNAAPDDLRHYFTLFVVALYGAIASFGPALIGIGRAAREEHPRPFELSAGSHAAGARASSGPPAGFASGAGYVHPGYWPPYQPALPPSHAGTHPANGDSRNQVHGAPINIHFGAGGLPLEARPAKVLNYEAQAEPAVQAMPAPSPGILLPPPSPAAQPVRNGRIKELADHLLTFEAACLLPVAGARVTAEEAYGRYRSWAGGRAIGVVAFLETLPAFSEVVERVDFGGVTHFEGVQLRDGVALKGVA